MKLYKAFIAILLLLLYGCTKQEIVNTADELTMHSWSNTDKYNKEINLCFKDDIATITVITPNYKTIIEGTAVINDTSFTISDDKLKQCFTFEYLLYGDKIELSYNEIALELHKNSI